MRSEKCLGELWPTYRAGSDAGNVTPMALAPTTEVIETDGIVAPIVSESIWRRA